MLYFETLCQRSRPHPRVRLNCLLNLFLSPPPRGGKLRDTSRSREEPACTNAKHSLYGRALYVSVACSFRRLPLAAFDTIPPGGRRNNSPIYERSVCILETFGNRGFFLPKIPKIFPFYIDKTFKKRYNIYWIFMITNRKEK